MFARRPNRQSTGSPVRRADRSRMGLLILTVLALVATACQYDPAEYPGLPAPWQTCNGLQATMGIGHATALGDSPGGETYAGTAGVDVVVITNGPVTFNGLGGDDVICVTELELTNSGVITINAGSGNDTVLVEANVDTVINGGPGNDSIRASGRGHDTVDGGGGIDACSYAETTTNCEGGVNLSGYAPCTDPAACLHPQIDDAVWDAPVLSIRYLPDTDDDGIVDAATTGYSGSVAQLRATIDDLEIRNAWWATEATRYRGHANAAAVPSIGFEAVYEIESLDYPPLGTPAPGASGAFFPDYDAILSAADICGYVDDLGVREVWMYTHHFGTIVPAESKMSSSVGDISNSFRYDDMPHCEFPYVLYNFNFERGVGEMMHNRGHQIEATHTHHDADLFVNDFVGGTAPFASPTRCGDVHWAPNSTIEYVTDQPFTVTSDCATWEPGGGTQTTVSCATWFQATYGDPTCTETDADLAFLVWWMQNMPGHDNGLADGPDDLTNWWRVMGEFEAVQYDGSWLTDNPTGGNNACFEGLENGAQIPLAQVIDVTACTEPGSTFNLVGIYQPGDTGPRIENNRDYGQATTNLTVTPGDGFHELLELGPAQLSVRYFVGGQFTDEFRLFVTFV